MTVNSWISADHNFLFLLMIFGYAQLLPIHSHWQIQY